MAELSVVSPDGTVVGYERTGQGPGLVLVHGASADHNRWQPVLPALAEHFTVDAVDRRGRGLSTAENPAYDIAREAEDVAAVVAAAGPDVTLLGHSYGALCVLRAAALTDQVGRIVLYEPPIPTPGHHIVDPPVLAQLRAAVEAGDREAMLEIFLRHVALQTDEDIAMLRRSPAWTGRLAAAPTIARELVFVAGFEIDDALAQITVPVRMLLGAESAEYIKAATHAVLDRLPHGRLRPLLGQGHLCMDGDPEQFVAAVLE
ncbi:alpha/beta fold hydrolase [Kutzneria sp. NPDC052558]|uniref:alpha/beta fold hydrolase n=1 Tax=Kutzneria sp. NPDC052558 TaxID=3364121 RepID=UPI0037C83A1F